MWRFMEDSAILNGIRFEFRMSSVVLALVVLNCGHRAGEREALDVGIVVDFNRLATLLR